MSGLRNRLDRAFDCIGVAGSSGLVIVKEQRMATMEISASVRLLNRRATIADVAKLSGVTPATVSRVLNDKKKFSASDAVRAKISAAARKLDYVPDLAARNLNRKGTHIIGLFAAPRTHMAEGINESLLEGISEVLHAGGYDVFFELSAEDPGSKPLPFWRFDGAILMQSPKPATVIELDRRHVPYVCINERVGNPVASVLSDYVLGMTRAVNHLSELGHKRIAYANARATNFQHYSLFLRHDTVLSESHRLGIRLAPEHNTPFGSPTDFLKSAIIESAATAVITYDHHIAVMPVDAAAALGLQIPGDLSLICFNDVFPVAIMPAPLTTVAVSGREMGRVGGDLLLKHLAAPSKSFGKEVVLPEELIIRASTVRPSRPSNTTAKIRIELPTEFDETFYSTAAFFTPSKVIMKNTRSIVPYVLFAALGFAGSLAMAQTAGPAAKTLRQAAGGHPLMGCAVKSEQLNRPALARLIAKQFDCVTGEYEFKANETEPTPNHFTFTAADKIVAFARAHQMKVIGHNLCWHEDTPAWMYQDTNGKPLPRKQALANLKRHIDGVVGHFKGKVLGWDVVNEAISDTPGQYLRDTPARRAIGDDYIEQAFKFAAAADPNAELYYNDYNIETPGKLAKTIRLIRDLKSHGCRIDTVGIQGHCVLSNENTPHQLDMAIAKYAALSVKVSISELDVDVLPRKNTGANVSQVQASGLNLYPNGLPPKVAKEQANYYRKIFDVVEKHQKEVERVTLWGTYDGGSWLNNWPVKGRTNYPLLWNRKLQPKPAFFSVLKVLNAH